MITHAADLTVKETLCGLTTCSNICGWIFTENNMKLNRGQQQHLFEDKVSCEACLKIAKETRIKNICEECGKSL